MSATQAASKPSGMRAFLRGLRFRLAISYLAFLTVLLCVLGLLFREMLDNTLYQQSLAILDEEWGEMKGYLRIENARPVWAFDRFDPEESFIVGRIQRVYIAMAKDGTILERSDNYGNGILKPPDLDTIAAVLKTGGPVISIQNGNDGIPYMIRAGIVPEERSAGSREPRRDYYVSVGRPLSESERVVTGFTWRYFATAPFIVALAAIIGWLLAGRALQPLEAVAQAARRITGSNLRVQIPPRGAGDELDELIEAFNRMTQRLQQSFEKIRQFSTDVSHELRTPLTGIRGQLEVALFTAETPDQFREAMLNALQDVEQLSNMVRALLLLSQAETGQVMLQTSDIDLARVVADMVEQYQIPAEDEHVALSCEAPGPCPLHADKMQIERLVSNLVSNAIKYTPAGGRVSVGVECSPEAARLWVEDTGVGIPPENLPHIFDRFYRVRGGTTSTKQGLGLGLSFVAWIVNAHGGKIDVDSAPGKGTRFTVQLPRQGPPVAPERTQTEQIQTGVTYTEYGI